MGKDPFLVRLVKNLRQVREELLPEVVLWLFAIYGAWGVLRYMLSQL
ncbi:hypothetical protein ACOZ38_45090 [Sphaerisporangium viridialbum]